MDSAIMVSHRNMLFSTSQMNGYNEELAKVYTVRSPYFRQEYKDDFQAASYCQNSCSSGSFTLVSCNGRTPFYIPVIHLSQNVSHRSPLECGPDREGIFQVIICPRVTSQVLLMWPVFKVPNYAFLDGPLHDVPTTSSSQTSETGSQFTCIRGRRCGILASRTPHLL